MMEWSPKQAMKAYMNTLELSKVMNYQDCNMEPSKPIEPECMELISALAAGNRAKLMVEITSGGLTPFTVALAVAAKQTGGGVVCVLPPVHSDRKDANYELILTCNESLRDVVEFVVGNPSEVMKKLKRVEFLVVDSMAINGDGGQLKLWENVEVNPRGCVVVATNLVNERSRVWVGEITKGKKGFVESVTLPIGNGVELTKIRSSWDKKREFPQRLNRFHVTFDN